MTNHSTKIQRAQNLSAWGKYPATFSNALAYIPDEVIAFLPARVIAAQVDSIVAAFDASKSIARREVASDGGLYVDGRGFVGLCS